MKKYPKFGICPKTQIEKTGTIIGISYIILKFKYLYIGSTCIINQNIF